MKQYQKPVVGFTAFCPESLILSSGITPQPGGDYVSGVEETTMSNSQYMVDWNSLKSKVLNSLQ